LWFPSFSGILVSSSPSHPNPSDFLQEALLSSLFPLFDVSHTALGLSALSAKRCSMDLCPPFSFFFYAYPHRQFRVPCSRTCSMAPHNSIYGFLFSFHPFLVFYWCSFDRWNTLRFDVLPPGSHAFSPLLQVIFLPSGLNLLLSNVPPLKASYTSASPPPFLHPKSLLRFRVSAGSHTVPDQFLFSRCTRHLFLFAICPPVTGECDLTPVEYRSAFFLVPLVFHASFSLSFPFLRPAPLQYLFFPLDLLSPVLSAAFFCPSSRALADTKFIFRFTQKTSAYFPFFLSILLFCFQWTLFPASCDPPASRFFCK